LNSSAGLAVFMGAFVPVVSVPLAAILLVSMVAVQLPNGFLSIKLLAGSCAICIAGIAGPCSGTFEGHPVPPVVSAEDPFMDGATVLIPLLVSLRRALNRETACAARLLARIV
jgi:hypothetical protein